MVVGRCRPLGVTSRPTRALTRALFPVPVPPNVATISGLTATFANPAKAGLTKGCYYQVVHEFDQVPTERTSGLPIDPNSYFQKQWDGKPISVSLVNAWPDALGPFRLMNLGGGGATTTAPSPKTRHFADRRRTYGRRHAV